jgi:hypothetical protein
MRLRLRVSQNCRFARSENRESEVVVLNLLIQADNLASTVQ